MPEKTVLERAKANYKRLSEDMQYTHEVGQRCMEFVAGDQWEPGEIRSREETARPMGTINQLDPFLNQVVNKNAMERARIRVAPHEDTDADKGKVVNGLIRHIQYNEKSDAGEAYNHGFYCMGAAGFGYWRVDTEYCDEQSFDKDILIRKIDDPFSVFLDPNGKFCILIDYISKEEADGLYGVDSVPADWDNTAQLPKPHADDIMRVEYWELTEEDTTLYKIEVLPAIVEEPAGGMDLDNDIAAQSQPQTQMQQGGVMVILKEDLERLPENVSYNIIDERPTKIPKVKQYFFAGDETLEENDWPGKHIPIIGCFSREHTNKNDEKFYKPIIYDGIDPQQMYNFYKSQDAELMQAAPKATWMGAKGAFTGFEKDYDEANQVSVARLEYNPVVENGVMAPPPQRVPPPMPSQGYYQNMAAAREEIKDSIGMWQASLGQQGNEVAAKAIIARRQQGDVSTYHNTTFFNQALWRTGIVAIDLVPGVYDTARTIRILGEDMADEVVRINEPFVDDNKEQKLYDLTVGKYDIKIDIGANSLTRRQDAAENLLEFARVLPQAGAVGADMIVGNLDTEKADELALRMKAALSMQMPGLFEMVEMLQKGGGEGSMLAAQNQQLKQQLQKLTQLLQQQGKQMQALQQKVQQNKIAETQMKVQGDIQETKIKTAGDIEQELIKGRFNRSMQSGAVPGGSSIRR